MEFMPDKLKDLKIRLEQQKRVVDEQLKAIEIVERLWVEQADESTVGQLPLVPKARYKDSTIKEAIFDIFAGSDKEWKARDVTDHMKAGGYKFSTNKPVPSVSTTLKRLAKEGMIEEVRASLKGNIYRRRKTVGES